MPDHFAGDDSLEAAADVARAARRGRRCRPLRRSAYLTGVVHDTRAPRRSGRAGAPLVENSIEPAVEQVVVPARERRERLGEHAARDRPGARSFAFERRRPAGEIRRKCHRADVDAVADHDGVGHAFRQNAPELPPRDEEIVGPLEIDAKRRWPPRPLRRAPRRRPASQRRGACRRRCAHGRASERRRRTRPLPGGDSHAWPRRPRPAVCASAITTAPSRSPDAARARRHVVGRSGDRQEHDVRGQAARAVLRHARARPRGRAEARSPDRFDFKADVDGLAPNA